MLAAATRLAEPLAGTGEQWQHPYGRSRPEAFLDVASVWFNSYPASLITAPRQRFLEALADPRLLGALEQIGIEAIHTGPVKRAGSVASQSYGSSIDGYFDRIELTVDPVFGTNEQYRQLVQAAHKDGIAIIGDTIPGHTGKGPDFRLAEFGVPQYVPLYSMTEISREDWGLLPRMAPGADSVNLSRETALALKRKGYIVGPLDAVIFKRPGIKESNWSATGIVRGIDGRERRWVYLHLFKDGQPSLNWLDPSFAAQRLVAGDVIHSLHVLGARGLRLDANMFLGVGPRPGDEDGWLVEHPLSTLATETLAMLIRKLGGFSFQELNVSLDRFAASLESGPELGYDFTTRPAYLYALASEDAGPLRLMLRLMLRHGVQPARMAHALQNHDELMLEASHLKINGSERFDLEGGTETGAALFARLSQKTIALTTGAHGPWNEPFAMSPGVCSTLPGFIAASLGVKELASLAPAQVEEIRARHLAAAAFNALQPGAFVVSGWDLVGALPVDRDTVHDRLADNDCRWLNRGAYDLVGAAPSARASASGLPKATMLYGSLTEQLSEPGSFVARLRDMLAVRRALHLDHARLLAVPESGAPGAVLMLFELPGPEPGGGSRRALTAVNFSRSEARVEVRIRDMPVGTFEVAYSTRGEPSPRVPEPAGPHVLVTLAGSEAQLIVFQP